MKSLFQSIPEPDLLSGNSSRDKERQGEKKGGWRNKVVRRDNRRVRPPILNLRRRNKPRDKTAPVSGESIIFFKTAINLLHCLMCYWEVFSSSPNWFWSDLFPIHPQNQKKNPQNKSQLPVTCGSKEGVLYLKKYCDSRCRNISTC